MTSHKDSWLDRAAERVMDLDSPAYGDERERAVFMEASSFGLTTGLYLSLAGAAVAAVCGLVLLPVALLVVTCVPAAAAAWYANRRGVNVQELAGQSGARSTLINVIVAGGATVLSFAAMSYTVFAGRPLLAGPSIEVVPGEGFLGGMVQGAVIGGMIGGLIAIIGGTVSFRRARRGRPDRG